MIFMNDDIGDGIIDQAAEEVEAADREILSYDDNDIDRIAGITDDNMADFYPEYEEDGEEDPEYYYYLRHAEEGCCGGESDMADLEDDDEDEEFEDDEEEDEDDD